MQPQSHSFVVFRFALRSHCNQTIPIVFITADPLASNASPFRNNFCHFATCPPGYSWSHWTFLAALEPLVRVHNGLVQDHLLTVLSTTNLTSKSSVQTPSLPPGPLARIPAQSGDCRAASTRLSPVDNEEMTATKVTRKVYSAEELHRLRGSQSQPKLHEAIEERDAEDAEIVKGEPMVFLPSAPPLFR